MKKISIGILFFAASFAFASCTNRDENGSTDTSNTNSSHAVTDSTRGDKSSEGTETKMAATANEPADKESTEFAMKAASGGMLEVKLGKLAQQNAQSQRVKNFGSMMVTDHSEANDELKAIASSHNITVPEALMPEHQKHIDMMSKMKGADFDKRYMSMMVDDHKEDIDEFTKEANGNKKDAFSDFAAKTLPVLQKHLDSAKAIHGSKM